MTLRRTVIILCASKQHGYDYSGTQVVAHSFCQNLIPVNPLVDRMDLNIEQMNILRLAVRTFADLPEYSCGSRNDKGHVPFETLIIKIKIMATSDSSQHT